MDKEQLQNLIVAIEGLIKLTGEGRAITEAAVTQSLQRAQIDNVQNEAILAILQENKQKTSKYGSRGKMFHAEQIQALKTLRQDLIDQLSKDNGSISAAIAAAAKSIVDSNKALIKANSESEPNAVKVTNFDALKFPAVQKVEITNPPIAPEQKPVELAKPKWYEALNYVKIIESFRALLSNITLKVKHEDVMRVNVIDDKGKVINDFSPVQRVVGGGGGGDNTYLKNKDGQAIDPATEEKQDEIIAVIQNEVEAKMDEQTVTIKDLYNQLSSLLDRLDFGLLTDNAKRLKINIEAGTLPVVTTVSSVTSMTNQVRQGDLQMQRVNEALLDTAFINGITNNISIT